MTCAGHCTKLDNQMKASIGTEGRSWIRIRRNELLKCAVSDALRLERQPVQQKATCAVSVVRKEEKTILNDGVQVHDWCDVLGTHLDEISKTESNGGVYKVGEDRIVVCTECAHCINTPRG